MDKKNGTILKYIILAVVSASFIYVHSLRKIIINLKNNYLIQSDESEMLSVPSSVTNSYDL